MYQVITMYGDNEPWWFFEEWQEDIQETAAFEDFDAAVAYYEHRWSELQRPIHIVMQSIIFECILERAGRTLV